MTLRLFLLTICILTNCPARSTLLDSTNESTEKCSFDQKYWKLIRWFFVRTCHVKVIQVQNEIMTNGMPPRNTEFSDIVMEQMWLKSSTTFKSCIVPEMKQAVDDDAAAPHQIFNSTSNPEVKRKRVRRDETQFGALIYAPTLSLLDNYVRTHRFALSSGNFVFIVTETVQHGGWHIDAGKMMAKLWNNYGILYAILIIACHEEESTVGYYDPFYRDERGVWGAMKWSHIADVDCRNGWILSVSDDFNRYPVRMGLFERYPTMVMATTFPESYLKNYYADGLGYANGYAGFDGLLVGNLAKGLNFRAKTIYADRYGDLLPNKTFTGAIGDVIANRIDAAINSRFIIDYETSDIDFLYPVFDDQFCIIAPGALIIPSWRAIFMIFDTTVWMLIVCVDIVCAYFWYFLIDFERKLRHTTKPTVRWYDRVTRIALDTFNLMTAAPTRMPERTLQRIFIASCLLSNLIIVGTFQGSLTRSFSTAMYEKDIDTLVELDASGLPIVASNSAIRSLFGSSTMPVLRSLRSKSRPPVNKNESTIQKAAYERTICGVERYSDVNLIIQTQYLRADGTGLVHIVRECPRNYHLAYIVRKGSPYQPIFNRMLLRFFESGLLGMWYEKAARALIMQQKNELQPVELIHAFTLVEMQTAFMVLAIGLVLSSGVFVAEILYNFQWNEVFPS